MNQNNTRRLTLTQDEKLNVVSHGFGVFLGVVGLFLLIYFDSKKTSWSSFSVFVYGLSIIILFSASTLYHAISNPSFKPYFRIVDHMSIYLLIAGTYTPVCLISLESTLGNILFCVVWFLAFFGFALKLFFTGRFKIFSTSLYVLMGWLILIDFINLSKAIGQPGVLLLFSGGVAYMVGLVFYVFKTIPYHHFIWHLFVLLGAILHFFMICLYVI